MHWNRQFWRAAAAVALVGLAPVAQAQAEVLVLRASGPVAQRFRVGTLLPDARPIRLGVGDTLELLSETGTWSWRGPGDFPAAVAAVRNASVMVAPDRRRARVGAVRSVGGSPTDRPNLWMVDIGTPGAVCVLGSGRPLLWRADADTSGTTTVAGPSGSAASITWTEGQAAVDWPSDLPLVDGGDYRLTTQGDSAPVSITVRALPAPPASAPAAGMALIERGCDAQMGLLVSQMEPREADAGS